MNKFNKFIPAVFIFSLSFTASLSVNATAAQDVTYLNQIQDQKVNIGSLKPAPITKQVTLQRLAQNQTKTHSLLASANQEAIPAKTMIRRNGGEIFKFFTRFNDNLQMIFSWFSQEEQPENKQESKKPRSSASKTSFNTCA